MNNKQNKNCCLLEDNKCTALTKTECINCKFYKSNKEYIRLNNTIDNIQIVIKKYS